MDRVSDATNCRTGPGAAQPFIVSLQPGQIAEVTAQRTIDHYWYIANPDDPGQSCRLWGEHASLVGDVSELPVLTLPPAPIPRIGFFLYHHSFMSCGNVFPPGAGAYIVAPISPVPKRNDAPATIRLCTGDYLAGDCVTRSVFSRLPD